MIHLVARDQQVTVKKESGVFFFFFLFRVEKKITSSTEFFLGYLSRFSAGAGDRGFPVVKKNKKKDFSFDLLFTPGEREKNINHHEYFCWVSICVNHNVQSFKENGVQLKPQLNFSTKIK